MEFFEQIVHKWKVLAYVKWTVSVVLHNNQAKLACGGKVTYKRSNIMGCIQKLFSITA